MGGMVESPRAAGGEARNSPRGRPRPAAGVGMDAGWLGVRPARSGPWRGMYGGWWPRPAALQALQGGRLGVSTRSAGSKCEVVRGGPRAAGRGASRSNQAWARAPKAKTAQTLDTPGPRAGRRPKNQGGTRAAKPEKKSKSGRRRRKGKGQGGKAGKSGVNPGRSGRRRLKTGVESSEKQRKSGGQAGAEG
jgi:hypothetical protein